MGGKNQIIRTKSSTKKSRHLRTERLGIGGSRGRCGKVCFSSQFLQRLQVVRSTLQKRNLANQTLKLHRISLYLCKITCFCATVYFGAKPVSDPGRTIIDFAASAGLTEASYSKSGRGQNEK